MYLIDNGVQRRAHVWFAGCVNTSEHHWNNVPENGCADNEKAQNQDVWGELFDVEIIESEGDTCGCNTFTCNRRKGKNKGYKHICEFTGSIKHNIHDICS